MKELKNTFLFLGSAAGVYSFIRLIGQDIFSFFKKPKLVIEFDRDNDVKEWRVGPPYIGEMEIRKVVAIQINNKGKTPALDCEAFVAILNKRNKIQKTLPIHWADTPYDARSTSIEKIAINKLPRRLDVVFTQEKDRMEGCSIASSQALATGVQKDQFFLSPGKHKIEIHINYSSGKTVKEQFIIESPSTWKELDMKNA